MAGAELDWLHRSGPRIGLAGAHASAADRNAASCEVAAAIVAATPRAGAATASATVGHHPRSDPLYEALQPLAPTHSHSWLVVDAIKLS